MPKPQQDLFRSLEGALASDRLAAYRRGDTDKDVLTRYLWNTALSESLYPVLQYLEIGLRNNLHNAISTVYGSTWYDRQPSILEHDQQRMVGDAKQKLQRSHKPLTTGRIVAELTFGFWTSLFNRRYEVRPNGTPVLWPMLLAPVFPHVPRFLRTRHEMSRRLTDIRVLRNRVFHHEPIWHDPTLHNKYNEIVAMIRWINGDLFDMALLLDRFPTVWDAEIPEYPSTRCEAG